MKTKFNLSEKMLITGEENKVYLEEDVKEFIEKLREGICECKEYNPCTHCEFIDKLAGSKLVGGKE